MIAWVSKQILGHIYSSLFGDVVNIFFFWQNKTWDEMKVHTEPCTSLQSTAGDVVNNGRGEG